MSSSAYYTAPNCSPESEIIEIVTIYENEKKTFGALGMDNTQAFEKIQSLLMNDLNIEIVEMFQNDVHAVLMIISAFFGRRLALADAARGRVDIPEGNEREIDLLPKCQHVLHTLMIMCFAAHCMELEVIRKDFGHITRQKSYENLKQEIQDLACKILEHLNEDEILVLMADYKLKPPKKSNDPEENQVTTAQLTSAPLPEPRKSNYLEKKQDTTAQSISTSMLTQSKPFSSYHRYLNKKFERSQEVFAIAYRAEAMQLLSQRPCLNIMKMRSKFRENLSGAISSKKDIKKEMRTNAKILNVKLIIHVIFRLSYLFLFARMLCKDTDYDIYFDAKNGSSKSEIFPYIYVLSVLIAQVSMTVVKVIDRMKFYQAKNLEIGKWKNIIKFFNYYFKSNKLALFRTFLIVPLLFLEFARFLILSYYPKSWNAPTYWKGLWSIVPIGLEVLYCVLFAIAAISSLRFFHFVKSLGFFVHLFQKMWKTVGMFILIFCTFWIVLAIIHVSITRAMNSTTNTIFHTVVTEGKFEIFGEVQDRDRTGSLEECSNFTRTIWDFPDMNYAEASCLVRSTLLPFLMFTYIFVAGVLLTNLLTAQLTKEYENETDRSRFYEGYLKYQQLSKIESKLYLPPPLSLIYVVIRFVFGLIAFVTMCCGSCGWLGKISGNAWEIVYKMEGWTWGTATIDVDSNKAEENMREFLKQSSSFWSELRNLVNDYNQSEPDENILKSLKVKFDLFFDEKVEEERGRTRAESRMASQTPNTHRLSASGRNFSARRVNEETVEKDQYLDDDPAKEGDLPLLPKQ